MSVLVPKNVIIEYEDIRYSGDFRALLISDLHIGFCQPVEEGKYSLFLKIKDLITDENANYVFILGDIVHFRFYRFVDSWISFYNLLDTIGTPICIIPGNHDRYMHGMVNFFSRYRNVSIINKELLRIFVNDSPIPLILGHDLKNDKKVHGDDLVRSWFSMLRSLFSFIPQESLMIVGHTHETVVSDDQLTYSISPFSYDLGYYEYGIVEYTDEGAFRIRIDQINE